MLKWTIVAMLVAGSAAADETLPSIDALTAQIDARVNALNPYHALLNDPDPERAIAAVEIMITSDNAQLRRMALEFGVLSSNPTVRRKALEAFFHTGPKLVFRFDGSKINDSDYNRAVQRMNGTLNSDGISYVGLKFGPFKPEESCFVHAGFTNCGASITANGIVFNGNTLSAHAALNDDGVLVGEANLRNVTGALPLTIRVID